MKAARSRFLGRALAVFIAAVAAAVVTVVLLLHIPAPDTGLVPLIATVVLVLLALGASALWNGIGLLRIRRLKPDALVFLARREPTLAPDLAVYLHRKRISVDVSDKWVPAVIDERGMAAWSSGFRPRELFVMEWSELGEVAPTEFRSLDGQARFGIAVDVKPFPTPLIVRVGHSVLGYQAAFDRAGTVAVSEAAEARRPVHEASS